MAMRDVKNLTILNAKGATGVDKTNGFFVRDYRNCIVTISTASSANLTVKCQGAIGEDVVDFTAAASATNQWTYMQIIDLNNGSPTTGATGVVYAGTDAVYTFEVNINALSWLNFIVTARSAGTVTVKAELTDNQ